MDTFSDALYQLAKMAEEPSDAKKWMKIGLELDDLSKQILDCATKMYIKEKISP